MIEACAVGNYLIYFHSLEISLIKVWRRQLLSEEKVNLPSFVRTGFSNEK
jgi:hypothetical protein